MLPLFPFSPLLPLVLTFGLLISGCSQKEKSPKSENHPKEMPSSENRSYSDYKEKTEIHGTQGSGSVLFVRQIHNRPEFTNEIKMVVGDYQFQILRLLNQKRPRHVFKESLFEDISPSHPFHNGNLCNSLRLYFSKGIPEQPTDFDRERLANIGAAKVYACLNDDVYLHKTLTEEENDKLKAQITKDDSNVGAIIFKEREALATRKILQFLKENPGEDVTLIFGDSHEFRDDFSEGSLRPTLISASFPEILKRWYALDAGTTSDEVDISTGDVAGLIQRNKTRPEIQHHIIQWAEGIPDWGFQHIATEEDQLLALEKLELDEKDFEKFSKISLKEYLLKYARSEKVKRRILTIFGKIKRVGVSSGDRAHVGTNRIIR